MYTRVWDETTPPGTVLANTLDTIIQNTKTDLAERLESIFGLTPLQFAADPIVPISLTLSGGLTGNVTGNLTGSILTAAQANITSLGTLTGLQVAQTPVLIPNTSGTYALGIGGTTLVFGTDATKTYIQSFSTKSLELNNQGNAVNIGGNTTINAGLTVTGSIVANLIGNVSGNLTGNVAGNLTGTVLTASQTNITTLGTLTTLVVDAGGGQTARVIGNNTVGGYIDFRGLAAVARGFVGNGNSIFSSGAITDFGLASEGGDLVFATTSGIQRARISASTGIFTSTVGFSGNITGNLTGTVLTPSQTNITAVGTLTSINTSGAITMASGQIFTTGTFSLFGEASSIGQIITGSAVGDFALRVNAKKILFSVDNGGSIAVSITSSGISANITGNLTGNVTGTILTAAQTNITSLGILTSLTVSGNTNTNSLTITPLGGVTPGAADSAGLGFRLLKVPN